MFISLLFKLRKFSIYFEYSNNEIICKFVGKTIAKRHATILERLNFHLPSLSLVLSLFVFIPLPFITLCCYVPLSQVSFSLISPQLLRSFPFTLLSPHEARLLHARTHAIP